MALWLYAWTNDLWKWGWLQCVHDVVSSLILSAHWASYSRDLKRKGKVFLLLFFFLIASSVPVLPLNYCRHHQFTLQMRPHKHWEQNQLYRIRLPAPSLMCVSFSNGKKNISLRHFWQVLHSKSITAPIASANTAHSRELTLKGVCKSVV